MPHYRGGKSPRNMGSGQWVAGHLPDEYDVTYSEPFGGMANILVNRPRSRMEIYNELDGRIYNFMRCVRDEGDEMARLISQTGRWDEEFREALERIDEPGLPPVRRALYAYILIQFSLTAGLGRPTFGYRWSCHGASEGDRLSFEEVLAIRDRLLGVYIYNKDGVDIVERLADMDRAIIYCDPPYPGANNEAYVNGEFDVDRLLDILPNVKGRVAISGYGTTRDSLGWRREDLQTTYGAVHGGGAGTISDAARIEVLWMNYEHPQRQLL